jgi:tetratricopeptide (TPR) repeat protein
MTVGMPELGRNDPCPCGSGKKYKKCCLVAGVRPLPPEPIDDLLGLYFDAMEGNLLDEAEAVARQLLERFPARIDGHERLAEVYAARRDHVRAADHYRQAAAGMIPAEPNYDPGYVPYLLYTADVHSRLARGAKPSEFDEMADSVAGDLIRGELDRALEGIADLFARDPGHHVAVERRGQLLEIRHDCRGAARDFREAAAIARGRAVDPAHVAYLIARADVLDPSASQS